MSACYQHGQPVWPPDKWPPACSFQISYRRWPHHETSKCLPSFPTVSLSEYRDVYTEGAGWGAAGVVTRTLRDTKNIMWQVTIHAIAQIHMDVVINQIRLPAPHLPESRNDDLQPLQIDCGWITGSECQTYPLPKGPRIVRNAIDPGLARESRIFKVSRAKTQRRARNKRPPIKFRHQSSPVGRSPPPEGGEG